jgi:hypothetical protein
MRKIENKGAANMGYLTTYLYMILILSASGVTFLNLPRKTQNKIKNLIKDVDN